MTPVVGRVRKYLDEPTEWRVYLQVDPLPMIDMTLDEARDLIRKLGWQIRLAHQANQEDKQCSLRTS